jgi:hypothetical protein
VYCDTVSKGKAQGEHTFKGSGTGAFVMTIGTDLHGNDAVMQASTVAGGGLELTMLTLKDKAIKSEKYGSDLWSEQRQGGLAALWTQPYVRKQGDIGFRALVKSKSLKLTFLQQDKMLWEREEALAYVQHAVCLSKKKILLRDHLHVEAKETSYLGKRDLA